ncbi:MAG: LolA family protein [Vulcanimicrobiaceae bacterium]
MTRIVFAAVLFASLCAARASAGTLSDFADTWKAVSDYSCSIVVHETLGNQTQDRRYDFWFKKPALAKIEIVSGPGKGSGSVWHGGDTVVGHQGGMMHFMHLTVSIHDSRAVDLRGDTMDTASFGSILTVYQSGKGAISEAAGDTIDGAPTDTIAMKIADPASNDGVTRDVLYLSRATHLPVRRVRYAGDAIVKQEDFVNVKINPGLKASDF